MKISGQDGPNPRVAPSGLAIELMLLALSSIAQSVWKRPFIAFVVGGCTKALVSAKEEELSPSGSKLLCISAQSNVKPN